MRTRLRNAFERALARAATPSPWSPATGDPMTLRFHGVLDADTQRANYRQGVPHVIEPCASHLLAESSGTIAARSDVQPNVVNA